MSDSGTESPRVSSFDMSRAAVFHPVKPVTAFEETVERLLSAVRLGILPPGERLPSERELAEQLQVGRSTLREAFRALQLSGHLETRRGRYGGTFVAFDPAKSSRSDVYSLARSMAGELEDALVMRRVLELGGVEAAALVEQAENETDHLWRCLAECDDASDLTTFRRADSRLHLAFAEMTRSPSLVAALTGVRSRINTLLDEIPPLEPNVSNSHRQHRQIVDAIVSSDLEAARNVMREHLCGTESLLRGFLSDAGAVQQAPREAS